MAGLLLKKYQERFSGAPLQATYAYLRQMALDALPPNPLASHETSARHLRDTAFLTRALKWGSSSPSSTVAILMLHDSLSVRMIVAAQCADLHSVLAPPNLVFTVLDGAGVPPCS